MRGVLGEELMIVEILVVACEVPAVDTVEHKTHVGLQHRILVSYIQILETTLECSAQSS